MTEAPAAASELYAPSLEVIQKYVDILLTRGIEWGLLGPREAPRVWDRHILNAAALTSLVPAGARVVDVGSGAGLPGIPLAVLRPDLELTLLEPLVRRSTFLTQAVDELGITGRVRVVRGRAEEHAQRYDVAVSRALAPLPKLVGWCWPLVAPVGVVVALKGRSAATEIAAAAKDLRRAGLYAEVLQVRAHPDAEPTTAVRVGPS